jgi:hypothetical protein
MGTKKKSLVESLVRIGKRISWSWFRVNRGRKGLTLVRVKND